MNNYALKELENIGSLRKIILPDNAVGSYIAVLRL